MVGDRDDLRADGLVASRVNWLIDPPAGPLACTAKIRSHHPGVEAVVGGGADGTFRAAFARPQAAVTPGQAVAFYDGSRVLGGGWIERSFRTAAANGQPPLQSPV